MFTLSENEDIGTFFGILLILVNFAHNFSQQHCKNEYDHFSHFRSVWQDLRQVKNYTDSTKHPKNKWLELANCLAVFENRTRELQTAILKPQELNPQADHSQVTQFQFHFNKSKSKCWTHTSKELHLLSKQISFTRI